MRSHAGEVVGRLQSAGDALLDVGVSAVVSAQDGVLETTRILKLEGELAVLALLGEGDTGTDGGDVGIVDQGNDTLIIRDDGADTTLRAACSTSTDLQDFDLALSKRVKWCSAYCDLPDLGREHHQPRKREELVRQQRVGQEQGATSW